MIFTDAGTDEGIIHLCNTNYSEQYLETYWGHTGAIFKIEWSPFLEDFFLRLCILQQYLQCFCIKCGNLTLAIRDKLHALG